MKKIFFLMVAIAITIMPLLTMAQESTPANVVEVATATKAPISNAMGYVAIGAGICVIGAGFGLALIGKAALDGITRNPEAASDIRSNMIVIGALLEGVAFFAIVVCLLIVFL